MRRLWMAWALCAAASAAAAQAVPPPELRVGEGGPFRAGESVPVTWSALPPGTEEFELLLRCESPIVLTLRLTESEEPDRTSLTWPVPEFPCGRARLLLRFGEEGEERVWAQSAPFRITADGPGPAERVDLEGGELWIRPGSAPAEDALEARLPLTVSAPGGTPPEARAPTAGAGRPAPPQARPFARPAPLPVRALSPRTAGAPRATPLRI